MSLFFLDFETRSEADLPSCGSYRYAEHPTTEILCAAWALDDGEVGSFPAFPPDEIVYAAGSSEVKIVAHNAEFEKSILREVMKLDLPIDRFIDTAAMSARMSLPRKLEDIAHFFKLDTAAKDEGKKSIQQLSKPRRGVFVSREARPDLFEKLEARCRQDVELMREIYHRLVQMEERERKVWQVTIEMNERGLLMDRASIDVARPVLEREEGPLLAEFDKLTGGVKLKSYVKLAAWCGLLDVSKSTVRKALRDPTLRPEVHRALTIYQGLNKSSIAKLDAMLDRMCKDDRVRGSFVYDGAERTGRWSANGVQPQNFPRGLGAETELAFRALHGGHLAVLFEGCPRPSPEPALTVTSTIANMLRGFISAPEGKTFVVGDLSQIEARALNWLAGQDDTVEVFATGGDPYCVMASRIYGREITKKDKDERFMGKQAVLGAGYGLGSGGFQFMLDETYDVQIEEEFAEQVVAAYRQASPKVVAFWARLQACMVKVIAEKAPGVRLWPEGDPRPLIAMGFTEISGTPYVWIRLPSGRKLYYANPELEPSPRGPVPRYFGRNRFSKGWTQVRTYGGKIAENVTQAFSRDVLAGGMLRLAKEFDLVGTVHDEIIAETEDANVEEKIQRFHDLMVQGEEWTKGLPLECEVFSSRRYRK